MHIKNWIIKFPVHVAAREREEVILKQSEEKEPLPDKEADQMAWVRAVNQHKAIAEEIIEISDSQYGDIWKIFLQVCCMKDTAAKTKQQIRITAMPKYLGLIMRCRGWQCFQKRLRWKKQDSSEKMKKGWQGNSENCRDV